MGSALRAGLLMGAGFGGFVVVEAIVTREGAVGVGGGVVMGVAFGAVMGVFIWKTSRDLSGLTPQQRSEVARAVRRGEAPREASLAPATIKRAQRVQEDNDQQWPYVILGGFALLAVVIAIGEALAGSLTMGGVLGAVFWLVFLPVLRWNTRRSSESARRAEAAASRM